MQERMLKALDASYGNVTKAAKAAKIERKTHYNWVRADKQYSERVNLIRHECHEEFKDLVREGVRKKVIEGNTTILAMCYRSLFTESTIAQMEAASPFNERLVARLHYVTREDVENHRNGINPFSAEGMAQYEATLRRQREETYGTANPPGYGEEG